MTETEARMRCLELAYQIGLPDRTKENVVEIAQHLYTFVNAPAGAEKPPQLVDKPQRGKPPARASDLLS